MKTPFLFDSPILPDAFRLPERYVRMAQAGDWPDLAPWGFLAADMARSLWYYGAMLLKFPGKPLIPFAEINDADGYYNEGYSVLACFDGSDTSGDPVVRIYDYGTHRVTPWQNKSYDNFEAWLAFAAEESADYKAGLADRDADA
ncbi:hypothetical protein [Achromobacter sp. Marseille-Q4962]|uniref:hypothetical protein n=1 Tax=Achromobacter sp. Marseille-Q4962 TaxID=2942202 RepID=UPI00207345AA|nr:hypothetical protein [Achromobacter sp. Marseille-Q4962]